MIVMQFARRASSISTGSEVGYPSTWVRDAHSAGVSSCWSPCPGLYVPDTCGSLCSRRTRPCPHGAPVFMGMDVREKVTSWLPPWGAGASRGLSDMKVGTVLSPGRGYLRQGVLRKELTWQFGGTAARPVCLRRVSGGHGGSWSLSSGQWAQKWDGSLGWSRVEEDTVWCEI